jgi:outer membrane protein TolC
MIKKQNNFIILFIFFSINIWAQQSLDYNQFLNNIKTNHPLVKRSQNIAEIGNMQLQSAKGNYDPSINGSYENKYYNGKNYYSVLSSEIKQPIFTNQYLKAGYEYGQGTSINPEEATSSYGLGYVGIEASLLQGMIIDKRRAEILKAQQYKVINKAEQKQLTNSILYDASINYAEWLYAQQVNSVLKYFYKLADDRLNAIKVVSFSGERASVDTIEAAMLVQQRNLDYQSSNIDFQKKAADIVISNWQSDNASVFNINLFPKDSLLQLVNKFKIKYTQVLNDDLINNPLIEQYLAKQKLLLVEKRYKAELIKPKLDVKYNLLTKNYTDNLSAQFSTNNYKWGAALSFPLFLRSSRADLKVAKLNLQNNTYELENKQNELQTKTQLAKNSIQIIEQQLATATKNVFYSKEMVIAEKLKFEHGESSLFLINTRETKWLESELKLVEYQLKYLKTNFNLIYLKGNLDFTF